MSYELAVFGLKSCKYMKMTSVWYKHQSLHLFCKINKIVWVMKAVWAAICVNLS